MKRTRSNLILETYRSIHRPLTDREVLDDMGFRDMNCVRPRITELIRGGKLIEVDRRKDGLTGHLVRMVTIPERPKVQQELPGVGRA